MRLACVLIVQYRVPMGKRATADILPSHAHFIVAVYQACIGQQFRTTPVERLFTFDHFGAVFQHFSDLPVHRETFR